MITAHLAERLDYLLREQGRPWEPASGDRFVVPGRDLEEVFVIAEMTIEVEELPSGRHIRFNGTTEWALDSILASDVLWIPWEHQLRELLGPRFVSLVRRGPSYVVLTADDSEATADDPETAYALAVIGAGSPEGKAADI
ncbi:MAG: pilus assembly protein CpaE [Nocardioides sp.]|uniref:pilus assembly protein CpaE n=1 Tax=Nocardioides sp. TaxID=35761 RepID=UPI0039E30A0A